MPENKLKAEDLSGKVFGRWTVLERSQKEKPPVVGWICQCVCGNKGIIEAYSLKRGNSKSCGCLQIERTKNKNTKHGKNLTDIYKIYIGMKGRCLNKKNKDYPNYGGRGIEVCEDWIDSFENFYRDMGDRPKGMTLDRIDNNKGYSKENCEWRSSKDQANNRKNNIFVLFKGKEYVLLDLLKFYNPNNFNSSTIYRRISKGMSIEDALNEPSKRKY